MPEKGSKNVKAFLANLKRSLTFCKLGDNFNSALRDQFEWGLRNENFEKKLLNENNLTYKIAVAMALSVESAANNMKEMQICSSFGHRNPVNWIKKRYTRPFSTSGKKFQRQGQRFNVSGNYYCCGHSRHYKRDCDSRDEFCDVCGIQGYLKVCNKRT